MRAIILAGGKGSRLKTEISDVPKPLAPVQGQPFIFILIRFLLFHGVNEILISAFHLSEKFDQYLEALRALSKEISVIKEPSPLGTGGAVRFICQKFNPEDQVLIMNGDTFFDFDLASFIKKFQTENAIALKAITDASRYGTVKVENGCVSEFVEKSSTQHGDAIYAGFCSVKIKDLLRLLPNGISSLETDFFPKLIKETKPLFGQTYTGAFIDIGVPEDYRLANSSFNFSKFSIKRS